MLDQVLNCEGIGLLGGGWGPTSFKPLFFWTHLPQSVHKGQTQVVPYDTAAVVSNHASPMVAMCFPDLYRICVPSVFWVF